MEIFLNFIDKVEYWHVLSFSLFLLLISTLIGDEDILPWVSGSFFISGLIKFLGASPTVILILFPFQLIILFYFAKPLLYRKNDDNNVVITEDINSMVNQIVRVISIDSSESFSGESISLNGKKWKISNIDKQPLLMNEKYRCTSIEGLTLIVTLDMENK